MKVNIGVGYLKARAQWQISVFFSRKRRIILIAILVPASSHSCLGGAKGEGKEGGRKGNKSCLEISE